LDKKLFIDGRKRVLLVLFIPSVERDGITAVHQDYWVEAALVMFGKLFGGATAYPKARGIWRDDERGGELVKDEPVVMHCYTTPEAIQKEIFVLPLLDFCRKLGRDRARDRRRIFRTARTLRGINKCQK
jgi:hypothetical protein